MTYAYAYNKCSENSRCQIVFRTDVIRKLSLGAPESLYINTQYSTAQIYAFAAAI